MSDGIYSLEIRVDMDGQYTGQAFYNNLYLSGSTFVSRDRNEIETQLRRFVEWYENGHAVVERIEL